MQEALACSSCRNDGPDTGCDIHRLSLMRPLVLDAVELPVQRLPRPQWSRRTKRLSARADEPVDPDNDRAGRTS